MSYLHCPSCKRAYNIAVDRACPACPVPATLVDPAEDIVAATEQLARAMARATPDEREDAMGRMDRLALPAPGAKPVTFHGAMVRSIREALDPQPAPRPAPRQMPRLKPLLAMVATRMFERLAPHVERYAPRARELSTGMRARMRALAA
jgi:acetyl esterase/lipase